MSAAPPKVLVVDDDLDNLKMVERFLGAKGMTVITTDSPFGVNTLLREENPDVVVLDVMMPALDGETVARFIRSTSDDTRPLILFYSAVGDAELAQLARRVPGSTFLPKTAGLKALHAAVLAACVSAEE